jgi:anti-sigma factor RsiW
MSERSWSIPPLPEQHLLPDAVVAFVDGELTSVAHSRVVAHLARCPMCAAEAAEQRQARTEVRSAAAPTMSAGLLAALQAIPAETDLPDDHDHLAMSPEGQLVAVQRPERAFGASKPLGSSTPLGGGNVLRTGLSYGRRTAQGAGVVAAGLVLGALAVVGPHVVGASGQTPVEPTRGDVGGGPVVADANFAVGGVADDHRVTAARSAAFVSAMHAMHVR